MHTIDLRDVLALRRPCPHPGCGVVFELRLDDPGLVARLADHRCEGCDATIPWGDLRQIRDAVHHLQALRDHGVAYELIVDRA